MRTRRFLIPCFAVFLSFCLSSNSRASTSEESFNAANRLYEQGKFAEAVTAYQSIATSDLVSAPLFYNLGNAFYKSGKLGESIVAFRMAELLSPRDSEIQANLRLALTDAGNGNFNRSIWAGSIRKFTMDEWTVMTGVTVTLFFLLLVIRELRPAVQKQSRWALVILASASVLGSVGAASSWHMRHHPAGVVVVPEAVARLGPFAESKSAFTLRDGAEVAQSRQQNGWAEIVDGKKRSGWIPATQLSFPFLNPSAEKSVSAR